MTGKERFRRMFEHREADRLPIVDEPWAGTISRWRSEGMPAGADWRDYFGVDKIERISINNSPLYPVKRLEETDRYYIETSQWGVTMKHFKEEDSTPEFLDFTITTPQAWEQAKARMLSDGERINWDSLKANYPKWQADGRWIQGLFWFGFDVAHSWAVGTETMLIAFLEEPEWVRDMFDTYLSTTIALMDRIWDAGYRFDSIFWYDDMGYKNTPFFSPALYRELLMPYHKKAVQWAHDKGIYSHLHSCGDISKLLPDVISTGVDALNPIEAKAGMDVLEIKKQYGDKLVLHGGINAVLWDKKDEILAEVERLVPALKENGGDIFSSPPPLPQTVNL
ncbi:MAG: hypothetical protein FWH02_05835 [Oscillospiraceae bacterium]|nr:hypothetical protein [Oscillospiraceae bacterium]